jgi:hypothetical protein
MWQQKMGRASNWTARKMKPLPKHGSKLVPILFMAVIRRQRTFGVLSKSTTWLLQPIQPMWFLNKINKPTLKFYGIFTQLFSLGAGEEAIGQSMLSV